MRSLAEFQSTMAADILDGGSRTAQLLPGDAAAVSMALRVHRNTVLGGLANALRLTYRTVAWLTGPEFFDQAVAVFAASNPPQGACMADYGEGFAEFLAQYVPAAGLPYLADAARFDLALERCAHASEESITVALDETVSLQLCGSVRAVMISYPADRLRDGCDSDDMEMLAGLDMAPVRRGFVFWRTASGVTVKTLSLPATSFLAALLKGEDAQAALAAAIQHASAEETFAHLQTEIFTAPFADIQSQTFGE